MQNKERKGKWQPFDALEGYSSAIKKVEKEKMKVEKPILFPDQLEALNEKLASAFTNKREIEVEYYNRGYLDKFKGTIKKIDIVNREIILNQEFETKRLKINLIINIEEIGE